MSQFHGWLTENAERAFPFRRRGGVLPLDFILDLKVFVGRGATNNVKIQSVSYSSVEDQYTIVFEGKSYNFYHYESGPLRDFSFSMVVDRVIHPTPPIPRASRTYTVGEVTVIFTPGSSWVDPSWGGESNWSISLPVDDGEVLHSLVGSAGPEGFQGITVVNPYKQGSNVFVGGPHIKIMCGYNIAAELSSDGSVVLNVGAGFGMGPMPRLMAETDQENEAAIYSINGQLANSAGDIQIYGKDCLSVVTPRFGSGTLSSRIQVLSSCLPCCTCENYTNVGVVAELAFDELAAIADRITETKQKIADKYNEACALIKEKQKVPMVSCMGSSIYNEMVFINVFNLSSEPVSVVVKAQLSGAKDSFSGTGGVIAFPSWATPQDGGWKIGYHGADMIPPGQSSFIRLTTERLQEEKKERAKENKEESIQEEKDYVKLEEMEKKNEEEYIESMDIFIRLREAIERQKAAQMLATSEQEIFLNGSLSAEYDKPIIENDPFFEEFDAYVKKSAERLIADYEKFKEETPEREKKKAKAKEDREKLKDQTANFPQWFVGPGATLSIKSYAKYMAYPDGKGGKEPPVLIDQRYREELVITVMKDPNWISESNLLEIESLIQSTRQSIVETTPGFLGHPWELKPINLDGLDLKNDYSL